MFVYTMSAISITLFVMSLARGYEKGIFWCGLSSALWLVCILVQFWGRRDRVRSLERMAALDKSHKEFMAKLKEFQNG